jgi:hypothetical protein
VVSVLTAIQRELLDMALDNDGLWEFADVQAAGSKAVGADAHRELREPMIDLVRAGFVTLFDKGGDLSVEGTIEVLSDPANWVLPWDEGGDWESGADAFGVRATPLGERALRSATQ